MNRYEIQFKGPGFSRQTAVVRAESDEEALRIFLANTPEVEKENIVAWNRTSMTNEPPESSSIPPYAGPSPDCIKTMGTGSFFDVGPSANYKTAKGLALFFSFIGWIGVAASVLVGILGTQGFGLAGIAFGFIAAFFCLLVVVSGQLLQAQVEVANNSREILNHLKSQRQTE